MTKLIREYKKELARLEAMFKVSKSTCMDTCLSSKIIKLDKHAPCPL